MPQQGTVLEERRNQAGVVANRIASDAASVNIDGNGDMTETGNPSRDLLDRLVQAVPCVGDEYRRQISLRRFRRRNVQIEILIRNGIRPGAH